MICCILYSEFKLINFAFELFSFYRYLKLVCINKLVDHPHFTRCKRRIDSFHGKSVDKGKETMGDNNEQISLTDVVVALPSIEDHNELSCY